LSAHRHLLWDQVDQLVARAQRPEDLRAHRLELIGARQWRKTGRNVPGALAEAERAAAVRWLMTGDVLAHARAAYDGPIVLMKGPEIAARYEQPTLRPFADVDLLVDDAAQAQAALVAAGFEEIGEPERFEDIHHLRPLAWRHHAVAVEIHSRPKWPAALEPPPVRSILDAAVPSATGIPGLLAPSPAMHALLVAAHAWATMPLGRLGDLIDTAALAMEAEEEELRSIALAWNLVHVWDATSAAIAATLFDNEATARIPRWARNLREVRERTVLEKHLEHLFADFRVVPRRRAVTSMLGAGVRKLRPAGSEGWRSKARRSVRAVRRARAPLSEHDRDLDAAGLGQNPWAERARVDRVAP
jgi:hypothetical protein